MNADRSPPHSVGLGRPSGFQAKTRAREGKFTLRLTPELSQLLNVRGCENFVLSLLFLNDDGAVRCGGDARFVHGFGRANSSALFVRHFYGVCSDLGGRLRRTRLIPSSLVNIHTPACRRVAKCANFNVLIVFRFGKKLPLTIQVWCNQFIVLLSSGSRSFTTCVERTLKNHEEVVQNAECAVIYVYTTNP